MANNTGIKYGDRQKGTANKATVRLRETFTELLENNISIVQISLIKSQRRTLRRHCNRINYTVSTLYFKHPKVMFKFIPYADEIHSIWQTF